MKPFVFDPPAFANEYKARSYVHVEGGVNPDFLLFAREQLAECSRSGRNEISARAIKNKKKQYLFSLPEGDFLRDLMVAVSSLTGLTHTKMKLSERHIMIYDENAAPVPPLHKDRVATQVAVGIPLEEDVDARIVLLPSRARRINSLDNAIYCAPTAKSVGSEKKSWNLREAEFPAEIDSVSSLESIELKVQPGDVVIFEGSSMYHGRLNAAKSSVLYFKFNAIGLDPLGEDPSTPAQREHSLRILQESGNEQILESVVALSPKLQRVSRHYTRLDWSPVLQVYVAGESEFSISESDLNFMFALREPCVVKQALLLCGVCESEMASRIGSVRRLAKLGGIDFLS